MPGLFSRGLFSRDRIVAGENFNRWRVPPASVAIHLCIGSVYAWSIFNTPLTRVLGVVGPAADDWELGQVVWIFSAAIVFLGLSAAFAGKWLERVGPRVVGTVAAACWGGGFLVGAAGIWTHQLWLLYLGYGVLGGCGLGLGYVSPVSTLIKWFPDRRGMAAGMAIMGFGGGAMIAAPLKKWLLGLFSDLPTRLGDIGAIELVTQGGRRMAEVGGQLRDVIVFSGDKALDIPAGIYQVGTGNSGVAETFVVLGVAYFLVMLVAAFCYRIPASGWVPAGWTPPVESDAGPGLISRHDVGIDEAMKTRQFLLVWIVLCFNVTAGIGVLGVAKEMMTEIFGSTLPRIVDRDGDFAALYVLMIGVFNMVGRFFWASLSDRIGRKSTYTIFFVLGTALYVSIPFTAAGVSTDPSVVWLIYFYAATMVIFTMYGGGFATIPAYLADLFGARFVGGIHGRLLTAWSTAGVLGPLAITSLRESERLAAIRNLVTAVDPAAFKSKFGAGLDQLDALIKAKTVKIESLLELLPPGTIDPRATLYNSTMYLMAALLAVALVANLAIRPVDARHHLAEDDG